MSYPVTYYCPHCETVVELQREGYLADKAVTPHPFEGWSYVEADGDFEDADGVHFVCGESGTLHDSEAAGCGCDFYLSFVKFENGVELDPRAPRETVEIADDSRPSSPRGPSGPDGPSYF